MSGYAVTDPYTGHRHADYDQATDAEVDAAIAAADDAYRAWARPAAPEDRATTLRAVAGLLRERADQFGEIQRRETGKPTGHGAGEAHYGAGLAEYFADHAVELAADMPVDTSGDGVGFVRRTPTGALLCIVPWNAPVHLSMRFIAPNLAIGNTVIVKPDPHCPGSAEALQRVMDDAGVPAGAVVTLRASNAQVAHAIADPRVAGVSLTGSRRAGAAVAEVAGRNLTKVALELGGSDPFVVLSADDLDAVVETAFWNRMILQGQACCSAKRFIVIDELHDAFAERLVARMAAAGVGDPEVDDVEIGSLCSVEAAERVEGQVSAAVAHGATLLTGGDRDGALLSPGVLVDVAPGNPVYGEEIFGPVATVHRVADEAEAIAVANDTAYGLGAFVFTTDPAQADRVADAIDAGMVRINRGLDLRPELPFGGVKASGMGHAEGLRAADVFVNLKFIHADA
ncbi:aldehyde dehydrogenase family protein [Demequina sp. SYSU T00039]|uniref:Aldehyde dehydrogenase family protein n=1 Tax=Demequina lignilytica TaxID=3051663 RepID=A0AAW7M6A6_9MICO|nr:MULTISPECIES: aldehyde dehydrogenase family protein [unclassified Demequina]MDN4478932.1 aldehyde dehydrogenase family protein [Demequina sp. SYSU T00039-1]MDN4488807.1 aldehyde dehydrogenase family protein [Demequina sp. SYSU T00039]MDN4491480.1 aldehyde dehydrogenase family protein [Demequina sp. SYSU T00068]